MDPSWKQSCLLLVVFRDNEDTLIVSHSTCGFPQWLIREKISNCSIVYISVLTFHLGVTGYICRYVKSRYWWNTVHEWQLGVSRPVGNCPIKFSAHYVECGSGTGLPGTVPGMRPARAEMESAGSRGRVATCRRHSDHNNPIQILSLASVQYNTLSEWQLKWWLCWWHRLSS